MSAADLTPSGSTLVSRTIAELRAQQARIDAALTALVALVQPVAPAAALITAARVVKAIKAERARKVKPAPPRKAGAKKTPAKSTPPPCEDRAERRARPHPERRG